MFYMLVLFLYADLLDLIGICGPARQCIIGTFYFIFDSKIMLE